VDEISYSNISTTEQLSSTYGLQSKASGSPFCICEISMNYLILLEQNYMEVLLTQAYALESEIDLIGYKNEPADCKMTIYRALGVDGNK